MTLYNLRSDGTITKWDTDGNIEAQYSVSHEGCTCPAGHRQTCRHRQMLYLLEPIASTHWFLDWDNGRRIVDFQGTLRAHYDRLAEAEGPLKQDTPKDTFPEGLSQTAHTTFVYTTNEPPLPITHVELNVPCEQDIQPSILEEAIELVKTTPATPATPLPKASWRRL